MTNDAGRTITDRSILRSAVGEPVPVAANKELDRLDKHCRHFIRLSPFLCLGTMSADGKADVTPRGDPPGFVKVLDDHTILIPDRPGNRRVDSMENILENPSVGIIFFVPGIEETLRLNGHASIVKDEKLLADMTVRGHVPKLAIQVEVEDVFFHCAKALKRARLWDPASRIDREDFPSLGQIIHDQRMLDTGADEVERLVEEDYREDLY
jgi:PPOX class probable FMN-dependent enzyme